MIAGTPHVLKNSRYKNASLLIELIRNICKSKELLKMNNQFSPRVSHILIYSKEEAERLRSNLIDPGHLFLGLLRENSGKAIEILNKFHVRLDDIKREIEEKLNQESSNSRKDIFNEITLSDSSAKILRLCTLEARLLHSNFVDTEHLLLALLKDNSNMVCSILRNNDVTYEAAHDMLAMKPDIHSGFGFSQDEEDEENEPRNKPSDTKISSNQAAPNNDTPVLDNFGFDLTAAARKGKLDPVVGREKEIEHLAQILNRRKKNNPVLIGEPGVGKSAIVEGLATRIIQHKVPRTFLHKRIIALDMVSLVAGTKYRGQFEERIRGLLDELQKNPNIILFIDEIHTIVGAGSAPGTMDAANILKPALARGEIQCIGATTMDEFRKSIEKDGALERRFQKIIVEPTTHDETLQILNNIRERYEDFHNVRFTDKALEACVSLTDRYISDRCQPDKAIDALDEAGSRAHITNLKVPKDIEEQEAHINEIREKKNEAVSKQDFEEAANLRDQEMNLTLLYEARRKEWELSLNENRETIDLPQIEEVVSYMSGIPVQKMVRAENIRLKGMHEALANAVIAQETAITKITKAIMRSRIGLKDPTRPIGTFMFLGPTGVGKTLLAKKLADFMFGSEDALIRIDMSEYMEKYSVSRLVGAPPGYVGYEEGGQLTERVRRHPYSIILLDEIEKANNDVFNLLLQVMDDGRLTDSNGRTVDFKNTVIIMTSNSGTKQLREFGQGIGFEAMTSVDKKKSDDIIRKALNKSFAPEFLNRIDEIIMFDPLTEAAIRSIADIEIDKFVKRVEGLGYALTVDNNARDFITQKGYDSKLGARPLKRAIQTYLEDKVCELMMNLENEENHDIVAYTDDKGDNLNVEWKNK